VPFVVKVPWSGRKGAVVDDVVSMLDLVPTVLDLTGVDQPEEDEFVGPWWHERHGPAATPLPGEVLTPVLLEGERPERRCALVEYDSDTPPAFDVVQMRMLVTNEHKLVYYAPTGEVMLFDRAADPEEMTNLAGEAEYQPVVTKLLQRLLHELCRTEPRRPLQVAGA
jgi:arylsulfatase A-like enzyme